MRPRSLSCSKYKENGMSNEEILLYFFLSSLKIFFHVSSKQFMKTALSFYIFSIDDACYENKKLSMRSKGARGEKLSGKVV